MYMNPKVSIVIPCYGVEKYISNIFDDLKKQNFKDNMEFIFVNDGGSNTLEDIIVDFAKKDSRVLLISKKNGGVSSARNKGIDVARGEWIMFVDPDDRLNESYVSCMFDAVNNSNSVLGIGGFSQFYKKKNHVCDYSLDLEGKDIPMKTAYWHFPPFNVPWNKIYKTAFLQENGLRFPEGITYLEDEHFCLRLYRLIDTCCLVKQCGYTYIMNDENSALSKYHKNLKENIGISSLLKRELLLHIGKSESDIFKEEIDRIGINLYILIINLFKKGTILNFFDSYKYIKNEIFKDAEFMRLFHLHDWSNDKMTVKVCDLLVSLKNPLLITIVFRCLFWIKYHR